MKAELYKMILVDDEDEVRGRIASKISEDSGFTVVGIAGNGYDALELIEETSPHIVLTDIKMPYIDGIELATQIKRDYPTVRVAFITGYDEFDYAREAVDLKVSGFLTKPITQDDISRFLKGLKEELDSEFLEKYNLERLKKHYEESLPMILESFFSSRLMMQETREDEDTQWMDQYGISLDDRDYLLAFVQLEKEDNNALEHEKMKLSVRSTLQSILERYEHKYYSFLFNNGIVIILKEKGSQFSKEIDPVFNEMIKISERFLSTKISIGVSNLYRGIRNLSHAYQESERALGHTQFFNTGRLIYFREQQEQKPEMQTIENSLVLQLEQTLKFGKWEEIKEQLKHIKEKARSIDRINFHFFMVTMVHILLQYADSIDEDIKPWLDKDIFALLEDFQNRDSFFEWLEKLLKGLRDQNSNQMKKGSQKMLDRAVLFIQQNYQRTDITMELVSEDLGISISYLSQLFKKHLKTTFVKFLTQVRMDKAKEILLHREDRIVEVAEQCGYKDVYYFSHSFKKVQGLSPKKYREKNL